MSHHRGEVIVDGRTVAHFQVDGCGNVVKRQLFGSYADLRDNEDDVDWDARCECGQAPQQVILWHDSDGGSGSYWTNGQVCLNCMAITSDVCIDSLYDSGCYHHGYPGTPPAQRPDAALSAAEVEELIIAAMRERGVDVAHVRLTRDPITEDMGAMLEFEPSSMTALLEHAYQSSGHARRGLLSRPGKRYVPDPRDE